jgi:ABC-type transporter Mla subunit MlaD
MYTKGAEFKAGVVVLLALAALLTLVYFAGGAEPFWGDYRYVHVRFEQSFTAPKVGDAAYMNGVSIGRVSEVQQREEVRGEGSKLPLTAADRRDLGLVEGQTGTVREVYVLAVVKMPADQRIPRGTTAQVDKSLTGMRTLALLPGLSRENLTDAMTRETPIPGREAPGLGDITSRINSLVEKVEILVGGGSEVMAEAKALLRTTRQKIEVFNTEELDRDARAALASLRRTLEGAEKRMDVIAANLEAASGDIKSLAAKGDAAMDRISTRIEEILADLEKTVGRIDAIVAEAEGPVREVLANLQQASHDLRTATEGIAGLGPDARALLAELGVDLKAFVENINSTAHNLLDASEDLRTHPWKLLTKPDPEDIAFANLRNASQSYMRAMRSVNEASARLFQILQRQDLDRPEIRALVSKAVEAFGVTLDGYRQAEARWQRLFKEANAGR